MSEQLRNLMPWLMLLQKYYQGHFCHLEEHRWQEVFAALRQEPLAKHPAFAKHLSLMTNAAPKQRSELCYEFNRLFVGPDAPVAPPYESCCINPEKTLMQAETLRVRSFYKKAGVELSRKNVEPDDFLAFELEFLIDLLSQDTPGSDAFAKEFSENHLFRWCPIHCKEVLDAAENPIVIAMALLLESVLQILKDHYQNQTSGG